jgi:hypothetical protein
MAKTMSASRVKEIGKKMQSITASAKTPVKRVPVMKLTKVLVKKTGKKK